MKISITTTSEQHHSNIDGYQKKDPDDTALIELYSACLLMKKGLSEAFRPRIELVRAGFHQYSSSEPDPHFVVIWNEPGGNKVELRINPYPRYDPSTYPRERAKNFQWTAEWMSGILIQEISRNIEKRIRSREEEAKTLEGFLNRDEFRASRYRDLASVEVAVNPKNVG